MTDIMAELIAAQERVAELELALKPFAEWEEHFPSVEKVGSARGYVDWEYAEDSGEINVSDLRRAARAMDKTQHMTPIPETDIGVMEYRASGKGNSVNEQIAGVKITHLPSGIFAVVTHCRSPHQNRAIAMDMLRGALASVSLSLAL